MPPLCWPLHNSGRFKEVFQDLSCSCVLLWGCETPAGGWTASLALLLGPSFSFARLAPATALGRHVSAHPLLKPWAPVFLL